MGYRTPEVGMGVATWAIRREWAMTHWRESASLMWRNLEHVTGRTRSTLRRSAERWGMASVPVCTALFTILGEAVNRAGDAGVGRRTEVVLLLCIPHRKSHLEGLPW
jgi:hypothetical protein